MRDHELPSTSSTDAQPFSRAEFDGQVSDSNALTRRFHRVYPGETLGDIAEKFYGDERFSVLLYYANEKRIDKDRSLRPGQILYVPFA